MAGREHGWRWAGVVLLATLLAGCGGRDDAGGDASGDDAERSALAARQAQVAADQATIGAFRVTGTRYRLEGQDNGWFRPYLDLSVENGTPITVTGFTLHATLASPGRAEPWMTQELTVPVAGSAAPGASFEVTLTPSPDSPWALANATPDARMKVEVLTVTAADGKVYLGAGSFRDEDAQRLETLE